MQRVYELTAQAADDPVPPTPGQGGCEGPGQGDHAHHLLPLPGPDGGQRGGAPGVARAHHDGRLQLLHDPDAEAARPEGRGGQGKQYFYVEHFHKRHNMTNYKWVKSIIGFILCTSYSNNNNLF